MFLCIFHNRITITATSIEQTPIPTPILANTPVNKPDGICGGWTSSDATAIVSIGDAVVRLAVFRLVVVGLITVNLVVDSQNSGLPLSAPIFGTLF